MEELYKKAKECCETLNCESCPLRNEKWCRELWQAFYKELFWF